MVVGGAERDGDELMGDSGATETGGEEKEKWEGFLNYFWGECRRQKRGGLWEKEEG